MAMGGSRHSYIRFYPSDWMAGTARLPRLLRSMYFDVCLHNWDYGDPMSRAEQTLVFADVPGWEAEIQKLIDMGKLRRTQGGGLYSDRAMNEAQYSSERRAISVASGKEGAAKRWGKKLDQNATLTRTVRKSISEPSQLDLETKSLNGHDNFDGHPNVVPIANQNQNQNQKKKKLYASKKDGDFQLPDWVPEEPWTGWVAMRKAMRHPITERGKTLAVTKLEELRGQGHDPGKLIDLATLKGWLSFYPDDRNGSTLASGQRKQEALSL